MLRARPHTQIRHERNLLSMIAQRRGHLLILTLGKPDEVLSCTRTSLLENDRTIPLQRSSRCARSSSIASSLHNGIQMKERRLRCLVKSQRTRSRTGCQPVHKRGANWCCGADCPCHVGRSHGITLPLSAQLRFGPRAGARAGDGRRRAARRRGYSATRHAPRYLAVAPVPSCLLLPHALSCMGADVAKVVAIVDMGKCPPHPQCL